NLALAPEGSALQPVLQLALLASRMLSAALYVEGVDALMRDPSSAGFTTLMQAFVKADGVAILSGTLPWHPTPLGPAGVLSLDFGALDPRAALECWREQMGRLGIGLPDPDLILLAGRFRLTAEQIADAVACAENAVRWSSQSALTLDHLAAAARAQCGHELAKLARKIVPNYTWEDIVLPEDQLAQLYEICEQAAHRQTVFGEWGFGRK